MAYITLNAAPEAFKNTNYDEEMPPPLILLWDVMWALEKGSSVANGVNFFLNRQLASVFYYQIETWWYKKTNPTQKLSSHTLSFTRRQLLEVLDLGLKGESIMTNLKTLEAELILSCEEEIQRHISLLPTKMMLPLLGLMFPSMMLLLVFPLLEMLRF